MLDRTTAERALRHLDSLPTLAPIALRLIQATADRSSDARELAALVRTDQALSAKLLTAANAAALGFRPAVTTIEQAVVTLGFSRVRSIALAVKIIDALGSGGLESKDAAFDRGEFWRHCLAVACAAQALAAVPPLQSRVDPEEAFVAGLLHDLGKSALDCVFPRAYQRIAAQADQARGEIADFERASLGIDHTLAGRRLAERWKLPAIYHDVIWLHHLSPAALPTRIAKPELVSVIQLADAIARQQRIGYSGNHVFIEPISLMAQRLGLSDDIIEATTAALTGSVAAQAEFVGLGRTTSDAMYLRAVLRANEELGRTNADLDARNQELEHAHRCFRALTEFDAALHARASLPEVVDALAAAARAALQRPLVVALGLDETSAIVAGSLAQDQALRAECWTSAISDEFREWARSPEAAVAVLTRVPLALRAILGPRADRIGADVRVLLIRHAGALVGALALAAGPDIPANAPALGDEQAALLASFGSAIARTNAHIAVARLAEDLADTNRRMQQMQAEVLRARSLSIIAEMAAGAGHELNNPLSVISGRAQMLLRDETDASTRRSLETICAKAHDCSRIVSDLMDFARPPRPTLESCDFAVILREVREQWSFESGVPLSRLILDIDGEWLVHADPAQIRSVVVELLRNASEAVVENFGTIHLSLRRIGPEAGHARGAVELAVRDTGRGMSPSVAQRAFDPFFSHRKAGRGRGLGLARVHRIIDAHSGRIWIESRPGEGTTVHVVLSVST